MAEIVETPLPGSKEEYVCTATGPPPFVTTARSYPDEATARTAATAVLEEPSITRVTMHKVVTTGISSFERAAAVNRPRIWINTATLPAKKAEAIPSNPAWVELLKQANLNSNPGPDNIPMQGLTYLMTGTAGYARTAIDLAMKEVAKGAAAYARDSGFDSRNVLVDLAICLDWCYPALTGSERPLLQAHIEGWCDWLLEGKGYHWNNPAGNYYWGHLTGLWTAALALGEDSPKAAGFLTAVKAKYQTQGLSYLTGPAAGGWVHDGSSYGAGSLFRIIDMLEAHRTAAGEDLMPGWVGDALQCKSHATNPDFKGRTPMGDQSGIKGLSDYDRASFLSYQNVRPSDPLAPNLRWWLEKTTPTATRIWFLRWRDFMWPMAGPSAPPSSKSYRASGAGFVSSRTDW